MESHVVDQSRQLFLDKLFGLQGRIAVVIGATGVLGGALAEGLAQAGATVIVAGRNKERGDQRVTSIMDAGGRAQFMDVDATDRMSMVRLCQETMETHGRVDVVVNCAGVNKGTSYEEASDGDWHNIMTSNLFATHLSCQIFGQQMGSFRGGSIINIGSVTADIPLSRVFAYSASKAAVVNLTQNVAREYATMGVRVNAICPGFFPAEQNRQILDEKRRASIMGQTPMARFGEPDELVGTALLLASPIAGSFITGAAYYVDGGFTAMRF